MKSKTCIDCGTIWEQVKGKYNPGKRCYECYVQKQVKKRYELKTKAVEYKGNICEDCGGKFHQCQYDFHHKNEDRNNRDDKTIGRMTHNCRPWQVIQEELDLCIMLCANCHRLRHFK